MVGGALGAGLHSSRGKSFGVSHLIGPPFSNVPVRYRGKVPYQSFVRDILSRLRGGGAGGVVFPDWIPSASDWVKVPQRSVTF